MARIVLVILIAAALWLGPGREADAREATVPAHGWWIAAELAFERGDCARALELFGEQAHHYYGAIARLGDMHEGGPCAGEGLPPAAELYERLIAEDLGIAGARLAYLHLHGLGVARDEVRARRLFKDAVLWLVVNESPERRRAVVAEVMSGHGVPTELAAELAAELAWLDRLEAGPARELYEAALKLKAGRGGLPRHEAAARRLVHRAAVKGLPEAFYTRGMWDLAAARDPDDRRWALWDIAHAADLGYPPALKEMGLRLAEGREVERDDLDAYWVLLRAQEAGADVGETLAEVARRLSADEIAVGRRIAQRKRRPVIFSYTDK